MLATINLNAWCRSAERSKLKPFITLVRQLREHPFEGIIASVEHGLSNSRLEGIIAKIRLVNRLINKRGFGHPNARSLAAMITPAWENHHPLTYRKVRRALSCP